MSTSLRRRWPAIAAIGAGVAGIVIALTVVAGGHHAEAPQPILAQAQPSAAAPPPSTTRNPVQGPLSGSRPVALEVPAIDVRTGPIVDLGLTAAGALQVPKDALTTGWFTGGPAPGETGPAVLAAHVDYNHVPGMFSHLKDLRAGAEALVHRADGVTAVFTVYKVGRYSKAAFPTEGVYGDTAGPELRLITCGGDFDRSTRNYQDNIVAYARLSQAYRG